MVKRAPVSTPEGLQRRLDSAKRPTSWQKRLDKAIFDIDKTPEQRVRLLQKVAQEGRRVQSDLRAAAAEVQEKGMGKGHPFLINLLFPEGTTARSDLEGVVALRKQLPELTKSITPPSPAQFQAAAKPSSAPAVDPARVVSELTALVTDEAKQRELREEAKNALRATPKGLETPKYKVLRTWPAGSGALDGVVELRSYEPFTVARKSMDGSAGFNSVEGGGAGFNSLASYLFGGNAQEESMAMTMPVEIEKSAEGGGASSMSFVLPSKNAQAPPQPNSDDVSVEEVPARLVAVKAFAGIVTDEEVVRQRDALVAAIEVDGSTRPVEDGSYSVLQYNAPYTVPWRRRNELAIVVSELGEEAEEVADEAAASDGAGVVSWYDSGVRL